MKKTLKLIRRFLMLMICIVPLLFILNIALLAKATWGERSANGGWTAAGEIGELLVREENGEYTLAEEGRRILETYEAWGILVEDGTGDVVWHSDNLPEEVPLYHPGVKTLAELLETAQELRPDK